jgi:hypothetical protein
MTIEIIRNTFGWCAIINMAFLIWWLLFMVFAQNWVYQFHSKWFKLSREQFSGIHYAGMIIYKISIFLFNIVPYLALRIVA